MCAHSSSSSSSNSFLCARKRENEGVKFVFANKQANTKHQPSLRYDSPVLCICIEFVLQLDKTFRYSVRLRTGLLQFTQ